MWACNFVVINLSALKLIRRREEKHSKERVMRVEQNSATGRPKPWQEKRQRARRQNGLGTVKFQSAFTLLPEILTYMIISNGGSVMESLF